MIKIVWVHGLNRVSRCPKYPGLLDTKLVWVVFMMASLHRSFRFVITVYVIGAAVRGCVCPSARSSVHLSVSVLLPDRLSVCDRRCRTSIYVCPCARPSVCSFVSQNLMDYILIKVLIYCNNYNLDGRRMRFALKIIWIKICIHRPINY